VAKIMGRNWLGIYSGILAVEV